MAAPDPCPHHPALPTETEIDMPPPPPPQPEVWRRSANYHPSIWGDHFLSYANNSHFSESGAKMEERHQELIQEVKMMVVASITNYTHQEQLDLIDKIQRLGVSYHFEHEIDSALQHVCDNYYEDEEDDLHTLALRFRLLRQQGHNVSSDLFNKLKDSEGKFKKSLTSDARGMLSLYEATHMRVHGEGILDEALEFTTTHLRSSLVCLSNQPVLATRVSHALKQPIRKALGRIEARRYISIYQQDRSHNKLLSNLAILDFNILQKLHQSELCDLTRWWKDLNFMENLPFARDRMVECYFWTLGVYFEPQYCFARRIVTKIIILTSVLDDIYDLYGTLDELVLFTDAIQRWDISAIDELPEYMRVCHRALLDVYIEMEQVLDSEGKSYRLPYAKAAMKRQVKAYFDEAKWYHEGYTPTTEEYMKLGVASSGYLMLSTITLVGMREEYINKETFDWVADDPLIVRASAVIARLMDDMVGHEPEQERGDVASAVECYMKQHGASEEETLGVFKKQVTDAWKDINQESLNRSDNVVPIPLLKRYLNLARVIDVLYKDKDAYTDSTKQTKDLITSLLIDPVPNLAEVRKDPAETVYICEELIIPAIHPV